MKKPTKPQEDLVRQFKRGGTVNGIATRLWLSGEVKTWPKSLRTVEQAIRAVMLWEARKP